jgi:hypothetical protein
MPATTSCIASPTPSATVTLSDLDRSRLHTVIHRGHIAARTRTRAQVLLKLGEGWSEAKIEEAFDVCRNTLKRAPLASWRAGWMQC